MKDIESNSPCGAVARKIHCRMKFEDITQIQMTLSDTGALWLTEPETAVIVIVYVPAGVPGLPLPPPPPCNPPPHEINSRTSHNARVPATLRPSLGLLRAKENNPAIGNTNMNMERVPSAALGTGAVVAIVRATTESPLPEPTCGGLNVHVVNAGSLEHE